MREPKGYNILLSGIVDGKEKYFAGTTSNTFEINNIIQELKTKQDKNVIRREVAGHDLRLNIRGLISINETTGEANDNLDRNDIMALALSTTQLEFMYVYENTHVKGTLVIQSYTETTDAEGNANYQINTSKTGKLELFTLSGTYELDSLTADDIYETDSQLNASAQISSQDGGTAYVKFVWDFGYKIVKYTQTIEFKDYETKTINATETKPSDVTPDSYELRISGAVTGSKNFEVLKTYTYSNIQKTIAAAGRDFTTSIDIKNNSNNSVETTEYFILEGIKDVKSVTKTIAAGAIETFEVTFKIPLDYKI